MVDLRLGLWAKYWAGLRLGPYVPTPAHVADAMLRLAQTTPADRVLDLGCGDAGVLVLAAKRFGARGVGVELDARLHRQAQHAVHRQGLAHMVTLLHADALASAERSPVSAALADATVVTLYLSAKGNAKLLPRLRAQLRQQHARVVSFTFPFPLPQQEQEQEQEQEHGVRPFKVSRVDGVPIYLYRRCDLLAGLPDA